LGQSQALCARGGCVDVLVGTLGGLGLVGVGVVLLRPFKLSSNANLDVYDASVKWRGRILIVAGAASLIISVLVHIEVFGP
jgi:hypothetical protein